MAIPLFRGLWIAALISNLGTWIQDLGQGWLMASLTPSPFLIALVSTATQLPGLLLALPAGVLADLLDRRRLLLATQAFLVLCAGTMALLTAAHWMGPYLLLGCTLAMGTGAALMSPTWQATLPDIVPRPLLLRAVVWNGIAWNLARALGPALGGLVVGSLGPAAAFALNAASFLATIYVLWRWKAVSRRPLYPPESFASAIVAGVRYARHSAELRAVLSRSALFAFFAAAGLALLPVLARSLPGGSARTYGLLLGSIGAGAIAGAGLRARLARLLHPQTMMPLGMGLIGAALLLLPRTQRVPALCLALLFFGAGWMLVLSSTNTSAQLALPVWVRARGLGIYLLVFSGAMAAGSAIAGHLTAEYGLSFPLTLSGFGLFAGCLLSALFPLADEGKAPDLTGHAWSEAPRIEDQSRGPVIVMVRFPLSPAADRAECRRAVRRLAAIRLRDGATLWRLYEDADRPDVLVEVFIVNSWEEHLRQHHRGTVSDRRAFERARELCGGGEPQVIHLVAAP